MHTHISEWRSEKCKNECTNRETDRKKGCNNVEQDKIQKLNYADEKYRW